MMASWSFFSSLPALMGLVFDFRSASSLVDGFQRASHKDRLAGNLRVVAHAHGRRAVSVDVFVAFNLGVGGVWRRKDVRLPLMLRRGRTVAANVADEGSVLRRQHEDGVLKVFAKSLKVVGVCGSC
jgi:hypothetical protein